MAEGISSSVHFSQTTVECEKCGTEFDVTWFCMNCPASLCNACKEDHSKDKLLKKHEVVPRSGSVLWSHGSWKVRESCKKHKNSELVTYCDDCNVPCCIDCMLEHHRHAFTKLETKYFEAETRLNSIVDDLSKSSIHNIQNEISKLKLNIESCNESFRVVYTDLHKYENIVTNNVAQSFEKLRQELSLKQNECISNLEDKIKGCGHQIHEIENFIAKTEQKIRAGGVDLIKYFPTPPSISYVHSDMTTPIPRFEFNEAFLNECKTNIGNISFQNKNESSSQGVLLPENLGNEKGSRGSKEEKKKEKDVPDFRRKQASTFEASMIGYSIEPVNGDAAWVASAWSDTMNLYNSEGKKVRSVRVQGSNGIFDMAVQNNGGIILACVDKKLRSVSVDGKLTTVMDTTPFSPRGLCMTEKEEIIVCMSSQGDKNHVAVYTPDGKSKVREIIGRDRNNKDLFTLPYRIVIDDDRITVLNKRDNVVSVDQYSGKLLWMYNGGQAKLHKKFDPNGMCSDKFSNMFITDNKNHCIHYINRNGSLITIILVKSYGLEFPLGIGVDSQSGAIWCGDGLSGNVLILLNKYADIKI